MKIVKQTMPHPRTPSEREGCQSAMSLKRGTNFFSCPDNGSRSDSFSFGEGREEASLKPLNHE